MNRLDPIPETRKPGKMGFDFFYVMPVRCSCCGAYFQLRNDDLWKSRCLDCASELYGKPEEPLPEE